MASCGGARCPCLLQAGTNISITGDGNPGTPYVISSTVVPGCTPVSPGNPPTAVPTVTSAVVREGILFVEIDLAAFGVAGETDVDFLFLYVDYDVPPTQVTADRRHLFPVGEIHRDGSETLKAQIPLEMNNDTALAQYVDVQVAASGVNCEGFEGPLSAVVIETDPIGIRRRQFPKGSTRNLIQDGGFEQYLDTDVPDYLTGAGHDVAGAGAFTALAVAARSGGIGIRYDRTVAAGDAFLELNGTATVAANGTHIQAFEDQDIAAEIWARAALATHNEINLRATFYDEAGVVIGAAVVLDTAAASTLAAGVWTRLGGAATAPAGTAYVVIDVNVVDTVVAGVIDFDDAFSREVFSGECVPGPVPTTSPVIQRTAPGTATILDETNFLDGVLRVRIDMSGGPPHPNVEGVRIYFDLDPTVPVQNATTRVYEWYLSDRNRLGDDLVVLIPLGMDVRRDDWVSVGGASDFNYRQIQLAAAWITCDGERGPLSALTVIDDNGFITRRSEVRRTPGNAVDDPNVQSYDEGDVPNAYIKAHHSLGGDGPSNFDIATFTPAGTLVGLGGRRVLLWQDNVGGGLSDFNLNGLPQEGWQAATHEFADWRAMLWYRLPALGNHAEIRIQLLFYDSEGTILGSPNAFVAADSIGVAGTWFPLQVIGQAPTGTAWAAMRLRVDDNGGASPGNLQFNGFRLDELVGGDRIDRQATEDATVIDPIPSGGGLVTVNSVTLTMDYAGQFAMYQAMWYYRYDWSNNNGTAFQLRLQCLIGGSGPFNPFLVDEPALQSVSPSVSGTGGSSGSTHQHQKPASAPTTVPSTSSSHSHDCGACGAGSTGFGGSHTHTGLVIGAINVTEANPAGSGPIANDDTSHTHGAGSYSAASHTHGSNQHDAERELHYQERQFTPAGNTVLVEGQHELNTAGPTLARTTLRRLNAWAWRLKIEER